MSRVLSCLVDTAPALTIALLLGPVIAGLLGSVLPAFGYLPAIGLTTLSFDPARAFAAAPGITASILLSLAVGLATTFLSVVIVVLGFAAFLGTHTLDRLRAVVSPLLAIPHAAAAFGFAFLIAPSGWIMRLISPEVSGFERPPDWLILNDPNGLALIAGLIAKEIPFLFLMSLAALPQIHANHGLLLARSLGYGRVAGFLKAVFPALYRQIRLPILAVIAYGTSVVDVALILGPTSPPLLAVRIVDWISHPDLTMRTVASVASLAQVGLVIAAIGIWIAGERLIIRLCTPRLVDGWRFRKDAVFRLATGVAALYPVLVIFAGLVVLALWSLARQWRFPDALPATYSPRSWSRTLGALGDPIAVTLGIALVSTMIAVALALLCLEREHRRSGSATGRALVLLYVPLIVPQVSFLFGLNVAIVQIGWTGSLVAVIVSHLVFVMPFVYLSLAAPWRSLDARFSIVAATLGKSSAEAFLQVRISMLTPAILTATALGLSVSISLYLPTLLIGGGRVETVTTEALALASGGNRRLVGTYALVQTGLACFGFAVALLVPWMIYRNRKDMRTAP